MLKSKSERKKRVDWTPREELLVFLARKSLEDEGKKFPGAGKLWQAAQDLALPDKSRHRSVVAVAVLNEKYAAMLKSGKLNVKVDPTHNHVPSNKRPLIPVQSDAGVPPPAATPSPSASSGPADAEQVPATASYSPPPALLIGLDQVLNGYISRMLTDHVLHPLLAQQRLSEDRVVQRLEVAVGDLLKAAFSNGLSDRLGNIEGRTTDLLQQSSDANKLMLQLLHVWDPEAARHVEDAQHDAESRAATVPSQPPLVQGAIGGRVGSAPMPAESRKIFRVFVCAGMTDRMWESLPIMLPNCKVIYGDDQKPHALPRGKQFDLVVASWATSKGAMSVLRKHYADRLIFIARGAEPATISTISGRLDLMSRN